LTDLIEVVSNDTRRMIGCTSSPRKTIEEYYILHKSDPSLCIPTARGLN